MTRGAAGAQIEAAFVAWRGGGGPAEVVIDPAGDRAVDFQARPAGQCCHYASPRCQFCAANLYGRPWTAAENDSTRSSVPWQALRQVVLADRGRWRAVQRVAAPALVPAAAVVPAAPGSRTAPGF